MAHLGKYEIIEELGRGGYATVYKARDTELDRLVALKVLHPYWSEDPSFVARFRQEARTTARLRHPNIVTIHDAGEIDGQLYIAMECLTGRTLQQLLAAEGALTLERALPILEQLAQALDYAHSEAVVHRDVKPGNVMVQESADHVQATLTDFGLVKAMSASTALTSQGTLLGSPEYMAPEQADPERRDEIGPATDRYALGVVAYQMLAGRVPFPGNTPATLNAHLNLSPPDPRSLCADLPASVCRVLSKALSKSPRERYATAMAMVDALRGVDVPEAVEARKPRARPSVPPALLWGLVGVLVLVLLLGGGWLVQQWGRRSSAATATYTPTFSPTTGAVLPIPSPTVNSAQTPEASATRVREKDNAVMVYVPAGEFWMGSTDEDIDAVLAACIVCQREWFAHEQPRHQVSVDAFWIDRTEVTNAQYRQCVEEGVCDPPKSLGSHTREDYYGNPEYDDYPVSYVTWHQAREFAAWAGGRLPTEAEWEYACRGPRGSAYPWGDRLPGDLLLNYDKNVGDTTETGSYPEGKSWSGALDMSGNVWEWTQSLDKDYPYGPADGREDLSAGGSRVVRGGSFGNPWLDVRCAFRYRVDPDYGWDLGGFRIVSPISP